MRIKNILLTKASFIEKLTLLGFFVLLFALIQPVTAYAKKDPDIPVYHEKLDQIQQSIVNIQEHLKDTRSYRGHTLTELKRLESEISQNSQALKKNEIVIKSINKRIKELNISLKQLAKKLKKQRYVLSEQLRAAYALGSQQNLKMLLINKILMNWVEHRHTLTTSIKPENKKFSNSFNL